MFSDTATQVRPERNDLVSVGTSHAGFVFPNPKHWKPWAVALRRSASNPDCAVPRPRARGASDPPSFPCSQEHGEEIGCPPSSAVWPATMAGSDGRVAQLVRARP